MASISLPGNRFFKVFCQMGDAQFRAFLRDLFTAACLWTKPGGPIYIAHADSEGVNFRSALEESGFLLKQCLVWVKKVFALLIHMIRNSSARQNTVLDLCGGSGRTLIACAKLRRQARLMEIDPVYGDVIILRWQEFTGQQARHENGILFKG